MIKQELEKAIENGESVWGIYKKTNRICEIKSSEINKIHSYTITWGKEYYCYIKDLFKTKAEAEHYLHHANVTRTETLPFLTWEDIKIQMKKMESFGLNRNDRVLARIITKDSIYYFKLCKDFDLFTFQLKQTYIGEDLCEQIRDKFPVSLGEATEANFYKAYDEAVRLFRGE